MTSEQYHFAAQIDATTDGDDALQARADALSNRRTELLTRLGELVYEQTKTDPAARRGREVLYDGIAEVDRELENLQHEREHLAQLATPAGHAFCPFCGKQVSAAAIFCPQCGTRLTASDHEPHAATLTDQLEELDLDEPQFDEAPLLEEPSSDVAAPAGSKGEAVPADTATNTHDTEETDEQVGADKTVDGPTSATGTAAPDSKSADDGDSSAADTVDAGSAESASANAPSVLFSSRRDGIADALAPAADSVSAFQMAPAIIREARADLAPADDFAPKGVLPLEDEFEPAGDDELMGDAGKTQLLPTVDAGTVSDEFALDDIFDDSFDDAFDQEYDKRQRSAQNDPNATQVLPVAVVEAEAFENDATEVLPSTVDDAPDFEDRDATRIMTAIPDDAERYEPDPLQRSYRAF